MSFAMKAAYKVSKQKSLLDEVVHLKKELEASRRGIVPPEFISKDEGQTIVKMLRDLGMGKRYGESLPSMITEMAETYLNLRDRIETYKREFDTFKAIDSAVCNVINGVDIGDSFVVNTKPVKEAMRLRGVLEVMNARLAAVKGDSSDLNILHADINAVLKSVNV